MPSSSWRCLLAFAALGVAAHAGADEAAATPFAGATFRTVTSVDGVPLNVVDKGDPGKPAILFIHGYRQSYLSWSAQFGSGLAQRCRLVAFDLRGHGNSGVPWNAQAYDSSRPWGDDVASVIRATGLRNPLIVAWSFGGNVAMHYLRHYPEEKLAGLMLVDTGAGMIVPPAPPANTPLRPTQVPDLARNIDAVTASSELLFSKTLDPRLKAQFAAAAMRVSPFVDLGGTKLALSSNVDLLPKLVPPVTLVFGGKDPIIPASFAANVKQLFPGARKIDFPEAGHAPFLDEPERFNAILDELQCDSGKAP